MPATAMLLPRRSTSPHFPILVLALAVAAHSETGPDPPADPAPAQRELLDRLEALGYLASHPVAEEDRDKLGASDPADAPPLVGYQLLTEKQRIRLIDLAGNEVRSITAEELDAPALSEAEYLPDGSLGVIKTDRSLVWLDRDWKPFREVELSAHHDLASDGERIFVLTRRLEHVERPGGPLPLLVDYVTLLSMDGRIEGELSIEEAIGPYVPRKRIAAIREWVASNGDPLEPSPGAGGKPGARLGYANSVFDAFHTNYVHVSDRDIPGVCRRGDLLLSVRNLDILVFVRPETSKLVWLWGNGQLQRPHNAVLLPGGNILVFDNGARRKWSRVVELDPVRRKLAWSYVAEPRERFFSLCCGSAQKLPNGNVVITDATRGRVFEVTKEQEVVWEFWNDYTDESRDQRISILRSQRVPPEVLRRPATLPRPSAPPGR